MTAAVPAMLERPADPTRLEDALRRLRCEIEESAPDRPVSRSLAVDVIAVARRDREGELRSALARVLLRHPCRAFLLLLEPDAAPGAPMSASIGALTRDAGIGRALVLEQVVVRLPGDTLRKAPSVIRPLLTSDLPTHLFWAAPLPATDVDLVELGRLADRIIVDSCCFTEPLRDQARLQGLQLPLLDLTWFRLAPWRRALAEAFEQFPWSETAPTKVRIRHGPMPGATCASHQLAAWLRTRLQAKVTVEPLADPTAGAVQEPSLLELSHRHAEVEITYLAAAQRLRVGVTLEHHCLLPFLTPVSRGAPGDLLAVALDS